MLPHFSPAASRYSITFSSGLNGRRSSSPIDLMAIFSMSSLGIPAERCCLARKYLPASRSAHSGMSPTISVPVTRSPRFWAQRHTSSKALCSGVSLILVMFIDTWAMPYSSMNHPIAFVPLSVPGCITTFPFSSSFFFPVIGLPSRTGRPFSLTSNAMALARRVEVELRLKFTAMRKSRAPTTVQPVRATFSSYGLAPKSGFSFSSIMRSAIPSYSPLRTTARLRRFGVRAAAS